MLKIRNPFAVACAAAGAIALAAVFTAFPSPLLFAPALAQTAAAAAPDTSVHFNLGATLGPTLQLAGNGLAVVATWAV